MARTQSADPTPFAGETAIQGSDTRATHCSLDETDILSVPPSAPIVISSLSTEIPLIPASSSSLHDEMNPMQRISPNVILFKYFINSIFFIIVQYPKHHNHEYPVSYHI